MQLPSPLVIGWFEENLNPKDWTRCLPKTIGSEEPFGDDGIEEDVFPPDLIDKDLLAEDLEY